jgi:RHS repeat-associated protein
MNFKQSEQIPSIEVHSNYFRDFDPATGRYIESDPIGLEAGINTYAYVAANPLENVDPLGLLLKCIEYGERVYKRQPWSDYKVWATPEFLMAGPTEGVGKVNYGTDLSIPTPKNPRGGARPGFDLEVTLWWTRAVYYKTRTGYQLRSSFSGFRHCTDDCPKKDYFEQFSRDERLSAPVVTNEVTNFNMFEFQRPYSTISVPIDLPWE